jgi:hypothetical protein
VIAPAALMWGRPGYTRHEGRRFFGANIAHMVEQFDAAAGDLIDARSGRMAPGLAGLRVGAFWEPGDPALISLPGPAWLGAP